MPAPNPRPDPMAGGFPIAAGVLLGCALGFLAGQPTIGFLAGLALGTIVAVGLWLRGRS